MPSGASPPLPHSHRADPPHAPRHSCLTTGPGKPIAACPTSSSYSRGVNHSLGSWSCLQSGAAAPTESGSAAHWELSLEAALAPSLVEWGFPHAHSQGGHHLRMGPSITTARLVHSILVPCIPLQGRAGPVPGPRMSSKLSCHPRPALPCMSGLGWEHPWSCGWHSVIRRDGSAPGRLGGARTK